MSDINEQIEAAVAAALQVYLQFRGAFTPEAPTTTVYVGEIKAQIFSRESTISIEISSGHKSHE